MAIIECALCGKTSALIITITLKPNLLQIQPRYTHATGSIVYWKMGCNSIIAKRHFSFILPLRFKLQLSITIMLRDTHLLSMMYIRLFSFQSRDICTTSPFHVHYYLRKVFVVPVCFLSLSIHLCAKFFLRLCSMHLFRIDEFRRIEFLRRFSFSLQGVVLTHNASARVIRSNQSLVLQRVTRHSAGNYSCSAINAEGETVSNQLELRVKCKYMKNFNFPFINRIMLTLSQTLHYAKLQPRDYEHFVKSISISC